MAIKGSVKEAGLADVCHLLALGLKTGCLSVTDGSKFGQIYFDRGRITFATIVNRRDRLGDLLLQQGAVTQAQLDEAVEEQARRGDRRLGEILLDMGFIDTETLTACIQHQIQEAIYYLFSWRRGNFQFEPDRRPEAGEILISVNPESLLLEGARRIDEWSVIRKKVPSLDLVFAVDAARLEMAGVDLSPEQRQVLPLLDGRRTVAQVAEAAGVDEYAAARALYGLIQAGFAQRVGQAVAGERDPRADVREARNLGIAFYQTAMLGDAEREFTRVLAAEPGDPEARRYLALVALRRGAAAEAATALEGLLAEGRDDVETRLDLAYALRLEKRFDEALAALDAAAKAAPTDLRIHLARGATQLFAGESAAAAATLRSYRALADDEAQPATYYYCAALAEAVAGRAADAVALVEEGLVAHPASAPLLLLRGNLAEREADMAAAEAAYQQAAEEDPSLPQAHRNLGDMARRRGALHEALEHYRRAAELDPDLGDELYIRMAELYYRRNERDQAVRCWRRALELNPESDVARNHLEVIAGASR